MGSRKGLTAAFIIAVAALIAASCSTDGCMENQSSLPLAGFYNSRTKASMPLDSIQVMGIGVPGDSLLYTIGTRLTEVYLPFRATAASTSYCFHYGYKALEANEMNDTLTFHYTASPYFAGEECGAMYRYHINRLTYTRHLIDSIKIVDSLITNTATQQLNIFIATADEGADK